MSTRSRTGQGGRRPRPPERENHERWLVSYADFITLLFAFFVVMYATSSVNEGKYRVLSDSLIAAFAGPARSVRPFQVGEVVRVPLSRGNNPATSMIAADAAAPGPADGMPRGGRSFENHAEDADLQGAGSQMADIDALAERVQSSLLPLIDEDLVTVRRLSEWLEVEIKTSILFASGSARLTRTAVPVLEKVATILKVFPNPIQVEGFTDDRPINTVSYPSNWELSAARAASVVHLFTKYEVRPERMVAIGYGEHRPIADNDTPDGRAKNRRVVIVIPGDADTRRVLDVDRLADPHAGARLE